MKAVGVGFVLMLVATAAWGQAQRPATDAFRVSWDLETDPVDRRIVARPPRVARGAGGPFKCSPAPRH